MLTISDNGFSEHHYVFVFVNPDCHDMDDLVNLDVGALMRFADVLKQERSKTESVATLT